MRDEVAETVPEFIINSTKNIALISSVILFYFVIIDLRQANYFLAIGIIALIALYLTAAYRCHQGRYSFKLSLFGIAPVISFLSIYALYSLGIAASFWAFAALFVFYFVLPLKTASWINVLFVICNAPVAFSIMQLNEFTRFFLVLIGTSTFVFLCTKEIYKQNNLLLKLSSTDALTGLKNRVTLDDTIFHAIQISRRYKNAISLMIIDIDHFKKINDEFGHIEGDKAITNIADLLKKTFRTTDILFRLGGEEFLVLMHDTNTEQAHVIAERFRRTVENASVIAPRKVTVSIGVCQRTIEDTPQQWISNCDKQLYKAKKQGRNRTKVSTIKE